MRSIAFYVSVVAASVAGCITESGPSQGPVQARVDEQPRSSGATPTPAPSNTGAQTAAPTPTTGAATTPSPPASAPPAKPPAAPAPTTAAECKAQTAKITPPPNNQTDTQLQMRAFFDAYRETFRCCFDALWASQHPGASGTVNLLVTIDGTGAFSAAEIDPRDTSVQSTEVQTCIIDIAKSLPYPKPANGKNIKYTRFLNFSPHR